MIEPHTETLRLVIADDGVGFEPVRAASVERSVGWGLLNMAERAEAAGGNCQIESHSGEGAQIIVEVPR
jgi:signal transduction histidine kinase